MMSGYRCVNYYELCRLCTTSQGGKIHIFSEEGRKRNLYNKITKCLPIIVDENDKLPKIVCTMCVEQIDTLSEFREGCINAQTMLDSCLNSSKLRNGGKVYIKDNCTTKKTVINPSTLNIIKTIPSTINISTTGAQQQQTTNIVTNPDFLSSIIQAVGIQSMDDSQQDILQQQQQQQPQYTLTLDGQTIKANQIQYKIEEPTTYVIQEAPQQMSQQQQQPQQFSQMDEFLKLNTTKKIVTTPLTTTLKRELNADLGTKTEYINKGGTTQIISSGGANSGVSYSGTTTATTQLQTLQQNINANKKSKINLLLTTSPQKTTVATAATQKNTLQIQDLKFFPPNKCYVPITLKQEGSGVTNSIANIGTNTSSISCVNQKGEQQVLPTTYLQMKLEPFQLSSTGGLPTTLSIAPVTQHQQLQQQHQNNQITTTSQSIPVHSISQAQHHNNLLQHQNSTNTMTTVVSNMGQHQQAHAQNTNQQNQHQQQQQTVQLQLTTIPTSLANNIQQYSNKTNTVLQQQTIQATTIKQIVQQKQIGNTTINKVVSVANAKPNLAVIQQQQAAQQQQQLQQQQQQQLLLQQQEQQIITTTPVSSIVSSSPTVVTKSATTKKFATATVVSISSPNTTTTACNTISAITPTKTTDIASANNVVSTTATVAATTTTTTTATGTPGTPAPPVTVCELCKKQFKRKEHLMQHLKLHAGLRPFKCEKPDCNKSFSRKEHLLRHVISHTGKKLFSCDLCQKLFSRKDNLNKHRKTHPEAGAQNGPFYCEICQKSFAVKLYYVQHKAMHEKEGTAENNTETVIKQETHRSEENHSHELHKTVQQTHEIMDLQLLPIESNNNNNNSNNINSNSIGDVMTELKTIDKNGTVT